MDCGSVERVYNLAFFFSLNMLIIAIGKEHKDQNVYLFFFCEIGVNILVLNNSWHKKSLESSTSTVLENWPHFRNDFWSKYEFCITTSHFYAISCV